MRTFFIHWKRNHRWEQQISAQGRSPVITTVEEESDRDWLACFHRSDSMLVAPLKNRRWSKDRRGAVVTKDVPADTLVVVIPARAIKNLERKTKILIADPLFRERPI